MTLPAEERLSFFVEAVDRPINRKIRFRFKTNAISLSPWCRDVCITKRGKLPT